MNDPIIVDELHDALFLDMNESHSVPNGIIASYNLLVIPLFHCSIYGSNGRVALRQENWMWYICKSIQGDLE